MDHEVDGGPRAVAGRMTRIVAGRWGGRRIVAPAGERTRPTSERVREALFSSLESLTDLPGAGFLDLYAGSGAIGLEACSRGAARALLVESDARAARAIASNITALGGAPVARLAVAPVARLLAAGPGSGGRYDAVFADPPYAVSGAEMDGVLAELVAGGWLAPDAVVVLERASRGPEPTWPPGLTALRSRRYGETTLHFARYRGAAAESFPEEA